MPGGDGQWDICYSQARSKSSTDNDTNGTTNGADANGASTAQSFTNGHPPKKRKRGRPRLAPLPETDEAEEPHIKLEEESKSVEEDPIMPLLRRRTPGCKYKQNFDD